MKLSAFTAINDPEKREDPWMAAIASALNWADEVVVVDGSSPLIHEENKKMFPAVKWIHYEWPKEWGWGQLVKHYNLALSQCTGDWAIRFDADWVFSESWKEEAHIDFPTIDQKKRVATLHKISAVLSKRFYAKGRMPLAINRAFKDTCFGAGEVYTDLFTPIVPAGLDCGIPKGRLVKPEEMAQTSLYFYNYDHTFKTEINVRKSFYAFSMAHKKHFGETIWGETEDESFEKFLDMMRKRLSKCTMNLKHHIQPTFIHPYLDRLTPAQFGYDGWGKMGL